MDHFRGFDRYYEIEAGEKTAVNGTWRRGPKYELFQAAENALGKLNIIAEDLGSLDMGVYRLMDETGYPGMKVMEFAFDGNEDNPYLPKNIKENSVCYTGTHDNDTLLGYIKKLKKKEYEVFVKGLEEVLGKEQIELELTDKRSVAKAVLFVTLWSRSKLAVIPIQDILLLGSRSRMNTPSTSRGNWQFKLKRIESYELSEFIGYCGLTGRL